MGKPDLVVTPKGELCRVSIINLTTTERLTPTTKIVGIEVRNDLTGIFETQLIMFA